MTALTALTRLYRARAERGQLVITELGLPVWPQKLYPSAAINNHTMYHTGLGDYYCARK